MIWLGILLYGIGALLWTTCAVAYGGWSWPQWRRSWMGWSLLGSWASFAAVLILAVVLRLVPMPHAVDLVLAIVVLSAVDLAGLVQLVTVLRLQRRDRRGGEPHRRTSDHLDLGGDVTTSGTEWQVDRVAKVTDGDTVRLVRSRPVELDGRHYLLTDDQLEGVAIRLVWVDTPERGTHPGWEDARADLADWIAAHQPLRVVCYESAGWDRLLGDLLDADGNSASEWLMTERGWPAYVPD